MQTLFTGDPSTTVQYFPRVSIKIHCCRYWWLKNWEYSTLSFPFWRIYHNTGVGGVIEYRARPIAWKRIKSISSLQIRITARA